LHQRWILEHDLAGLVAMADPQFVRPLLRPGNAAFAPINLNCKSVLASGRNLTYRERASRALAHVESDRRIVFGIDRRFDIVLRPKFLTGEGIDRAFGLFARLMESLNVRAYAADALTSDMFGHIAPVRANVRQTPGRPADLRLQAPVPVGI